jgi:hypothetical protein
MARTCAGPPATFRSWTRSRESSSSCYIQDLVDKSRSINPPADALPPELVGVKLDQWRERVAILVNSPGFDWTVCGIILLNAIMIGIQADYVARTLSEENALRLLRPREVLLRRFHCGARLAPLRVQAAIGHGIVSTSAS